MVALRYSTVFDIKSNYHTCSRTSPKSSVGLVIEYGIALETSMTIYTKTRLFLDYF
jgi:hypothetical protein